MSRLAGNGHWPPGGCGDDIESRLSKVEEKLDEVRALQDGMAGVLARVDSQAEARHDAMRELKDAVKRIEEKVSRVLTIVDLRYEKQKSKFVEHHGRLERLEKDLDKTSRMQLDSITEELTAHKESQRHWLRYVVATVVAIVIAASASGITFLINR